MSQSFGPRHSGGYRPQNAAAHAAAIAALSGERPNAVDARRIPRALIDPDPMQPRTRFDPDEIKALRDSIELDGLLQPIKVVPVGERFRILVGHRRYYAMEGAQLIDAIVGDEVSDLKAFEAQLAENVFRENLTLADTCAAIYRLHTEFKLSHGYIAKNNFPRDSNGDQKWVGKRHRVWNKAKEIPELVELMQKNADVLTHAEEIVKVDDPALQRRMIRAAAEGKSVGEIVAMTARKVALKAPEPFSRTARAVERPAITIHRTPEPTRDELNEQAAALDWNFSETPAYSADSLSRALSTVENFIGEASKQVPIARVSATWDATAREALTRHVERLESALAAMRSEIND